MTELWEKAFTEKQLMWGVEPANGRGPRLGDDWYEIMPGVKMYFYDAASVWRQFGAYGLVELSEIDEPAPSGGSLPFINVVCKNG